MTYVCSDCTVESPEPGDCPCGAGPRLDLGDTATTELLVETDDRVQEKAKQRNLWLGVVLGALSVVAVLSVVPEIILAIPLPIPFANPIKAILLMILAALAFSKAADALWPGTRKFPQLKQQAGPESAVARMRSPTGKALVPLAAVLALGTVVGVGQHFAKNAATAEASADASNVSLGAANMPAEPSGPPPLFADGDFNVLSPGTLSLRGRLELEQDKTALLYRAPSGDLVVCMVEPDAASVTCSEPDLPLIPQTVRLVDHPEEVVLHGVESMGETPEETEYGAFHADGTRYDGDVEELELTSDRPSFPAPSPVWFNTSLDGVSTKLERLESGELSLTRGDEEPVVVVHDTDHGGPSTGVPIAFIGQRAAVVVFQMERGLSGLRVDAEGVAPLGP